VKAIVSVKGHVGNPSAPSMEAIFPALKAVRTSLGVVA
jgi:hypothetical protein